MGDSEKGSAGGMASPPPGRLPGTAGRNGLPGPIAKQTRPTPGKQSGGEGNTLINIKLNLDKPPPSWYA